MFPFHLSLLPSLLEGPVTGLFTLGENEVNAQNETQNQERKMDEKRDF